jgi:O-antigen biosynthesis protein WbqP
MYEKYTKRILDLTCALLLCIVIAPFAVIVAVAIKIDSPGPIIFRQKRYGRNGHPFTVLKFRTMSIDAPSDSPTNSLFNAYMHITRVGRVMRKLSIDELPQLINVLRGEMSIVGPRPVVLGETDLIAKRKENSSYALAPGITGWAQVNGRDELRIHEKAKMDGEYADDFGIVMDIKCLALTLWAVLSIKGHREGMVEIESGNVAE